MNENKDMPVLDYNKLVEYIKEKTNYEESVIHCVLDLEEEYLREHGIIVDDLGDNDK